jgi:hypothetical protein
MNQDMLHPTLPWWRVPTVWLVIGGPALVVVASIATLVIALHSGDPPLHRSVAPQSETLTPATQARNHAVTPPR